MGKLVAAAVLLVIAFSVLLAAATVRSQRPGPIANLLRLAGLGAAAVALLLAIGSGMVVIDPGEVGVRHAFGYVDPAPLLAGIRLVVPWSVIERYSTREEQWPTHGEQIEAIEALSSEQMGMHVEVSIRWQIDRSEEHTSELQSRLHLVCRLLLEKKKKQKTIKKIDAERKQGDDNSRDILRDLLYRIDDMTQRVLRALN